MFSGAVICCGLGEAGLRGGGGAGEDGERRGGDRGRRTPEARGPGLMGPMMLYEDREGSRGCDDTKGEGAFSIGMEIQKPGDNS